MIDQMVLKLGVRFGVLLAATNFTYQSIVWFSGLNRIEAALFVFFAFPPIAVLLAYRRLAMMKMRFLLPAAALLALVVAAIGALLLVPTMLLFLDVIGGGILPPVLQDQLEALRADSSGSVDVARRIARLEQLTPLRFAVGAAFNTFLLTILAGIPMGLVFRYRPSRSAAAARR